MFVIVVLVCYSLILLEGKVKASNDIDSQQIIEKLSSVLLLPDGGKIKSNSCKLSLYIYCTRVFTNHFNFERQ